MNWIACKDRMPKKKQFVLVSWVAKSRRYVGTDTYQGAGKWWLEYSYNGPSHWAPMPKPPK